MTISPVEAAFSRCPSAQSHDRTGGVQLARDAGLAHLAPLCSGIDDPDLDGRHDAAIGRRAQPAGAGSLYPHGPVGNRGVGD